LIDEEKLEEVRKEELRKKTLLETQKKVINQTNQISEVYEELYANLDKYRKAFVTSFDVDEEDEESEIRSLELASGILKVLENIHKHLIKFFVEYPSLHDIFKNEYISFDDFKYREYILETCFLNDYLFSSKQLCTFNIDDEINFELVESYAEYFENWTDEKLELHQQTENYLFENFTDSSISEKLNCKCSNCNALFRTKLREYIVTLMSSKISEIKEWLNDSIENKSIDQVSNRFYKVQQEINKTFFKVRYRFKRSSLNKLEKKIKTDMKLAIGYETEVGKSYSKVLINFFQELLEKENINTELITFEEYDRFFGQLGISLYRNEPFLKREFSKLKRSVLAIKRQDISSNIIIDYIGQFWLHSNARRLNRKVIYHLGPTNSGKTYYAVEALCNSKKGCYLAPLRLLAAELFDTMNAKGVKTSLITGEEVIEYDDSTHFSSTIEMAKMKDHFDCVVIDEIQMISDKQRGWAWTRALINMSADEIHLCGDPSALDLITQICKLTGDSLEIKEYQRMTDLKVLKKTQKLGDLEKGDALIVFSRRNALKYKRDLEHLGFKVSIVYGRLGPDVRREQARKFDQGETDVIVSTDAISMGMNLPIKRIVFSTLSKFINNKEHVISSSEIKQIAGRAGRFKRFPVGYVTALDRVDEGIPIIEEALKDTIEQKAYSMVGPDIEIFKLVNSALNSSSLPDLSLSEFLRLFNTMSFQKPFNCVELKEMIEVTEMVENADDKYNSLTDQEVFGFSCAPVDLGLVEHVQYFSWILNKYVASKSIVNEPINHETESIDYLETAIKCVELFQWLSRHFNNKNFLFDNYELTDNKVKAINKLNTLLSQKLKKTCSSCGVNLSTNHKFNICEECFHSRRFRKFSPNRSSSTFKFKEKSKSSDKSNKGKVKIRKKTKNSK
jgi:ATP-dependent RNA helicase SUPV3L1/SUV3